ncbi:MAG: tRNA (adenosine(37)-N6)-threonylcarbamoyltransferase complex dimerization subunit type 1 TsaB [Planctomycetota bacterium]
MTQPLVLALETSSLRGSIALGRGGVPLAERVLSHERRHAAELLPGIAELLVGAGQRPGDVGVVAFSQGPGSFTGLRIAATIARLWRAAGGCAVVGVPSLEVIAHNALPWLREPRCCAVMLDARRAQVFSALFELRSDVPGGDGLHELSPAALRDPDPWIRELPPGCVVLGDAVPQHRAALQTAGASIMPAETWPPQARGVLARAQPRIEAGAFCQPADIVPLYLRPPECEEVYEQRRAAAKARRGGAAAG